MSKYEEPVDEDVEEFEIPADEGDEAEIGPVTDKESLTACASSLVSTLLFMVTVWRTGRGMFGTNPVSSRHIIVYLLVAAVAVFFFSGYSLKVTRPHEGTVIRGLALTATVLSALSILLLITSLATLMGAATGH